MPIASTANRSTIGSQSNGAANNARPLRQLPTRRKPLPVPANYGLPSSRGNGVSQGNQPLTLDDIAAGARQHRSQTAAQYGGTYGRPTLGQLQAGGQAPQTAPTVFNRQAQGNAPVWDPPEFLREAGQPMATTPTTVASQPVSTPAYDAERAKRDSSAMPPPGVYGREAYEWAHRSDGPMIRYSPPAMQEYGIKVPYYPYGPALAEKPGRPRTPEEIDYSLLQQAQMYPSSESALGLKGGPEGSLNQLYQELYGYNEAKNTPATAQAGPTRGMDAASANRFLSEQKAPQNDLIADMIEQRNREAQQVERLANQGSIIGQVPRQTPPDADFLFAQKMMNAPVDLGLQDKSYAWQSAFGRAVPPNPTLEQLDAAIQLADEADAKHQRLREAVLGSQPAQPGTNRREPDALDDSWQTIYQEELAKRMNQNGANAMATRMEGIEDNIARHRGGPQAPLNSNQRAQLAVPQQPKSIVQQALDNGNPFGTRAEKMARGAGDGTLPGGSTVTIDENGRAIVTGTSTYGPRGLSKFGIVDKAVIPGLSPEEIDELGADAAAYAQGYKRDYSGQAARTAFGRSRMENFLRSKRLGVENPLPAAPMQPGADPADVQAALATQADARALFNRMRTLRNRGDAGWTTGVPQAELDRQRQAEQLQLAQEQQQQEQAFKKQEMAASFIASVAPLIAENKASAQEVLSWLDGVMGGGGFLGNATDTSSRPTKVNPVDAASKLANPTERTVGVLSVLGVNNQSSAKEIGEALAARQRSGQPLSERDLKELQAYLKQRKAVDPEFGSTPGLYEGGELTGSGTVIVDELINNGPEGVFERVKKRQSKADLARKVRGEKGRKIVEELEKQPNFQDRTYSPTRDGFFANEFTPG